MGSDSDDDYMSDKLLVPSTDNDIRPGLLFNKTQKRRHEIYKREQEERLKRSKSNRQEQEAAVREEGLNTKISSDNKGFQLLAKMGYQPGSSLGKNESGIKEPINIVVRQNKAGVGKKAYSEVRKQRTQKLQERVEHFRETNIEKNMLWSIKKDFAKAQRVCEELDFRQTIKNPMETFFWTEETMKKLLGPKLKNESQNSEESSTESESEEEIDLGYEINEQNLFKIIDYLRQKYLYCMYCAFTATDDEDLVQNCPGPHRIDHDDM